MPLLLLAAAILGATAVATGAYAAHGLDEALAALGYRDADLQGRIDNFVTGSRYQLTTAAAVVAIALLGRGRVLLTLAGWVLVGGAVVFSGLLYVLAFAGDDWRWLGAIVPLGGLAMIAGWTLIGVAAFAPPPERSDPAPEGGPSDAAESIVRLEEILTHQQQLVQDLNASVTEIRRDADASTPKLAVIEQTVRRLVELQQGAEDGPDERPPHY